MLNCLIIDDEPLARAHIASYVGRVDYLRLVGSARNPVVGKRILDCEAVDVIFLDVKMPHMSGIELVKNNDIFQQVIVITAYPEYAVDGFEIEATDYLMKPVTFERFLKAVEKAKARIGGSEHVRILPYQPDFIYVKHNLRYHKVILADILYIESMLNYIRIVTASAVYIVYSSLKSMATNLPGDQFIRTHKSYLVALSRISSLSLTHVSVGGYQLPVSRAHRQQLKKLVLETGMPFNG